MSCANRRDPLRCASHEWSARTRCSIGGLDDNLSPQSLQVGVNYFPVVVLETGLYAGFQEHKGQPADRLPGADCELLYGFRYHLSRFRRRTCTVRQSTARRSVHLDIYLRDLNGRSSIRISPVLPVRKMFWCSLFSGGPLRAHALVASTRDYIARFFLAEAPGNVAG